MITYHNSTPACDESLKRLLLNGFGNLSIKCIGEASIEILPLYVVGDAIGCSGSEAIGRSELKEAYLWGRISVRPAGMLMAR